jgi:hypothetical protein
MGGSPDTGCGPRFAGAVSRRRERFAAGALSEPRPCYGARSWIGAPRLCRANRHLEPEFKRVACLDHQALPRRERTPVRLRLGNLAKLALVQRVYGRLEHRRGR